MQVFLYYKILDSKTLKENISKGYIQEEGDVSTNMSRDTQMRMKYKCNKRKITHSPHGNKKNSSINMKKNIQNMRNKRK